jgi:hypothetical protein
MLCCFIVDAITTTITVADIVLRDQSVFVVS